MTASVMESSIEVQNLGELQRDLSALADKLNKKDLVKIIRPGARVFSRAIKQHAPKRTGYLRSALKVKVGKGKANAPYATVMTTFGNKKSKKFGFYGFFVHNGVVQYQSKRNKRTGAHSQTNRAKGLAQGGWRIKPNPFVYDAFEANVNQVATTILSNIESML